MTLVDATTGEVVARSLAENEQVIDRGLGTFIEVGEALSQIRDQRQYRDAGYSDFGTYCRERWGLSRQRAHQMMDASGVVGALSNIFDTHTPTRESHAAALTPLRHDPEAMAEVMDQVTTEAAEQAARVTAERIAEKVAEKVRQAAAVDPFADWTEEENELLRRHDEGHTVVVNMHRHAHLILWAQSHGVYERIDRRSKWGNPFELPADGDRATVIANYRDHYLPHKPSLMAEVGALHGRILGCWCHPEPCHGDVLVAEASR